MTQGPTVQKRSSETRGHVGIRRSVEEVSRLGTTRLSANFSAYIHPAVISIKVIYCGYRKEQVHRCVMGYVKQ
jgi:hypothetical protein